jgi:nucleotide-binding universal stress UspA family protein
MRSVKKILVPTDLSSVAGAIEQAAFFANVYGASLTLFHAYGLPTPTVDREAAYYTGLEEALAHSAQRRLTEIRHELRRRFPDAPAIDTKAVLGFAADEIVAEVRRGDFDLIVMATHGRTGVQRMLLGSVAERVVRMSPVPVLTVHPGAAPPAAVTATPHVGTLRPSNIVVATDFSVDADRAVATGVELARRLGGRVALLHVCELPSYAATEFGVYVASAGSVDQCVIETEHELLRLRRRYEDCGVPIVTDWRTGVPAEQIVAFASAKSCDLLIVGSHGRRGWRRLVIGSVAERVVRLAPMPVLTVHDRRENAAGADAGAGMR